ncbi:hypothetical protein CDV50_08585 [Haematobacter massiliensis]|uniref:hypothetical protein n=1 Tax=Haematobacter massiliensis TaxID=195105 RepID=UPI000B49A791|nr:hypothetical protein [Haematobacter massiliensis]OWJ71860.1 hypothetical protein CDV50_08585 [Haematobacter massiliensis]
MTTIAITTATDLIARRRALRATRVATDLRTDIGDAEIDAEIARIDAEEQIVTAMLHAVADRAVYDLAVQHPSSSVDAGDVAVWLAQLRTKAWGAPVPGVHNFDAIRSGDRQHGEFAAHLVEFILEAAPEHRGQRIAYNVSLGLTAAE